MPLIFDRDQLVTLLKQHELATGIPVAFTVFPEMPAANQYITWQEMSSGSVSGDNNVYFTFDEFAVEYYSKHYRDFDGEANLEKRFQEAGVFWRRTTEYLDKEEVFMTIYYL